MNPLAQYVKKIWDARYFWSHLALADLRAKFRRSSLGLVWSILNPLLMTLLLTFIMGMIFHSPLGDYAPYVFSGLITWEFIVVSAVMGCSAFIGAEGYIKQFKHPLAIYPLRSTLVALVNFCLAFIGLLLWVAVWKPHNFGLPTFTLLLTLPLIALTVWPLAIITAFINTRFRDFAQLLVIVLQAIWYASPVFFEPKLFKSAGISFMVDYNPVFHVLNLIRAPLLYGHYPSWTNVEYILIFAAILWSFALYKIHNEEKKMVFYL